MKSAIGAVIQVSKDNCPVASELSLGLDLSCWFARRIENSPRRILNGPGFGGIPEGRPSPRLDPCIMVG